MTGGLLEEQDMEAVYAMFQVNLVAVAHLTSRVLPHMLARGRGTVVNNASISGYALLPRREHLRRVQGRRRRALASRCGASSRAPASASCTLVTPGVNTDMLDATEEVYGRHMDTSGWDKVEPAEWAEKVLAADRGGPPRPRPRRADRLREARLARARLRCSTRSARGCSAGSRGR